MKYEDMSITDFLNLSSQSSDEMGSLGGGKMVDYETGHYFDVRDEDTALFIASARSIVEHLCKRLREQQSQMKQINMIASDTLHSLHYGTLEKPVLQNLFSDIRDYSKNGKDENS